MSTTNDVTILGVGLRGLWLSVSLARQGFAVQWIELTRNPDESPQYPWQVGLAQKNSKAMTAAKEFLEKVVIPVEQQIPVQILLKNSVLELSGPFRNGLLNSVLGKIMGERFAELFDVLKAETLSTEQRKSLTFSHVWKLAQYPHGQVWPLVWLGEIRRRYPVPAKKWIEKFEGNLLDPATPLLCLGVDAWGEIRKRALEWAKANGVEVLEKQTLKDIGIENGKVTGVQLKTQSRFLPCTKLVYTGSLYGLSQFDIPVVKKARLKKKDFEPKKIWLRMTFDLSSKIKPEGIERVSSLVTDPLLPLNYSNHLLLDWQTHNEKEKLVTWILVDMDEIKRGAFLSEMSERIQQMIFSKFPYFEGQCRSMSEFADETHGTNGFDDLPFVWEEKQFGVPMKSKLANFFFSAPEQDRSLEMLSMIGTEMRVSQFLVQKYVKKEKKVDPKIHASSNGESLGPRESV